MHSSHLGVFHYTRDIGDIVTVCIVKVYQDFAVHLIMGQDLLTAQNPSFLFLLCCLTYLLLSQSDPIYSPFGQCCSPIA